MAVVKRKYGSKKRCIAVVRQWIKEFVDRMEKEGPTPGRLLK